MKLTSTSFKEGEMIPRQHTCDGPNFSPQLSWTEVPPKTKSLALICDDPDAPAGTWVHWVLYNIPVSASELPENVLKTTTTSIGALQGMNDFRQIGYGGPCPPGGTHRYYFKLFALDTMLNLEAGKTKTDTLKAIEGHLLAEAQLMGRYKRS